MFALSRLVSAVVLAAFAASTALAGGTEDVDPLDALKAVAKSKFEALHRPPAERARALADAARAGWQATFQEFQAGKIWADWVLPWSVRLRDAELALPDGAADSALPFERCWRDARTIEKIGEVKFQAGQFGFDEMAEVRWVRLQAELDWLSHRGRAGKAPSGAAADEPELLAEGLAGADWPRAKAAASQSDPRQLARERLDAAREALQAGLEEFQAGKITPEWVLDWAQRVHDAELALGDKEADPTPLLEERWKTLRRLEDIAEVKLSSGKLAVSDLETCRCLRLEAEIAWVQARKGAGKPGGRDRPAADRGGANDAGWARAKEEASRADLADLLRERLQAARDAYRHTRQEFEAGKITPNLTLKSSLRLLEADRAAAAGPKEEAAAVEGHWRRTLDIDAIAERKLAAGKIGVGDVMATRYARLEAETWMAAARPARDEK